MPTKLDIPPQFPESAQSGSEEDFWKDWRSNANGTNGSAGVTSEREMRLLATIAREMRDSVIITDLNHIILWTNAAASRIIGYSQEEMRGRNLLELSQAFALAPDTATAHVEHMKTGERLASRAWTVKKNGAPLLAEFEILPYRDENQRLVALIGISRDVTAEVEAERTLRETAEHLLDAQELANIGSWRLFVDTQEVRWSTQVFQMFGRDPSGPPPTVDEYLDYMEPWQRPILVELIRKAIDHGMPLELTFIITRDDGTKVHLHGRGNVRRNESGRVVEIYGTTQDITARVQAEKERLELQARVASAQRLESLGLLAGGVAHDFNNLLMGVMMDAGLVEREVLPNSPMAEAIANIREAASRMAELTSQLLAYSGRGRFVSERIDPNRIVADVVESFMQDVPSNTTVELELADMAVLVEIDPTQLRLVVSNLLANAREALGERRGRITLSTGVETTNTGSGVWVFKIIDTGAGMTEDVQRRIFEPFFSTKPSGRGLGLSTVHGLVQRSHGTIDVQSVPGLGTSMTVRLPTVDIASIRPASTPMEGPSDSRPLRILIADDEAMVRRSLRRMLELNRAQVVEVGDGAAALEILTSSAHSFDVALLDIIMPKMTGYDVLAELRHRKLSTKVVLMSGYNDLDPESDAPNRRFDADARLQKPFAWDELKRVMNSLIQNAIPAFGER